MKRALEEDVKNLINEKLTCMLKYIKKIGSN
jgi:hypothetical protein